MKFQDKLNKIIEAKNKDNKFSGVVLIKRGDEEIFSGTYGYANKTWKVENTLDTRFRIASISKMFTSVSILKLIEEGKISFDTKVTEYLELKDTKIPAEVTIYNLLTHTSGIADYYDESAGDEEWERMWAEKPIYLMRNISDYFNMFAYNEPVSKIGEKYHYNGAGYILLGMIIEKASGISYFDYVRENIFNKVGMNDSDFLALDEVNERVAEGYEPIEDDKENIIGWNTNVYTTTPEGASDGGATATAKDLIKFMQELRVENLLSEKMTKEIFSPQVNEQVDDEEFDWQYGYGIEFILDRNNENIVRCGHTGEEYGASCRIYHYPEYNLDIAILGNQGWCAGSLGWDIHDLLMEIQP